MTGNAGPAGLTVQLGPGGERVVTASETSSDAKSQGAAGPTQRRGSTGRTASGPPSDAHQHANERRYHHSSDRIRGERSGTAPPSSSGFERGRRSAHSGRSRRNHGDKPRENGALVAQLEKAQRAKAREEEHVYDDLLAKYFGDDVGHSGHGDSSGTAGGYQNRPTGPIEPRRPPSDRRIASLNSPQRTAQQGAQQHPQRPQAVPGGRHQVAPRGRGGRYSKYNGGKRGGRHSSSSRQYDPETLLKQKEEAEKALQVAEAKLKHSEEEKQVTQMDCEQMRQIVEAAVVEKARALEKQAEVAKQVELLQMQLMYLEQMHGENGTTSNEADVDQHELFEDEHGVFYEDEHGIHYLSKEQLQELEAQS